MSSSARQVTGVGPRHAFTFNGDDGGPTVTDNVVGVDIVASTSAAGIYHVSHSLGNTGYVAQFTVEHAASTDAYAYMTHRGASGITLETHKDGTGLLPVNFIHGIIYD